MDIYKEYFSNTPTRNQWEKIGIKRRTGVVVPLFSIYSDKSIGIGDFYDLRYIIQWCKQCGISIIQLLPLNDCGDDFSPYNCISSFALDPMYLCLRELKEININRVNKKIKELKKRYKAGLPLVDYEIKKAKLEFLYELFKTYYISGINKFERFKSENKFWLEDYALYSTISEITGSKDWTQWEESLKNRDDVALTDIRNKYSDKIEFYKWIQWQLFEQLKGFKKFANDNGISIIGDLPFLISRHSADVWSKKEYFNLEYSVGAPPDMYFALGQRWGMPPYNWDKIDSDSFVYFKEKLSYAENFYDMYRIDHFIGLFRLWIIHNSIPEEKCGLEGNFFPENVNLWEENGKKILNTFLDATSMLPIAEDLGSVPECSYKVLKEYGIAGMEIQRWSKERKIRFDFLNPDEIRINSVSSISTHDSSSFIIWWLEEAGTIDADLFRRLCSYRNITGDKYKEIEEKLFDRNHISDKRLLWNSEISSVDILSEILQRPQNEIQDIISQYLDSYKEKEKFINYLKADENKFNNEFVKKALLKSLETNSIFSIQLINEWLSLHREYFYYFKEKRFRINYPAIQNEINWRVTIPINVNLLPYLAINKEIKEMIVSTGRE